MRKLWTFGDSYTELFETQHGTLKDYCDWKGGEPLNFSQVISNELKCDLKCYGKGGASNRSILSQYMSVVDEIEPNDVLIFGWTNLSRFRAINHSDEIIDVVSMGTGIKVPNFSETSINETILLRNNYVFFTEILEYIKLIKKAQPNNVIINWTWHSIVGLENLDIRQEKNIIAKKFYENVFYYDYDNMEKIYEETNNQIIDHHYSENAHIFLAQEFIKHINNIN